MGSDGPGRHETAVGGSTGLQQLDLTRPDAYGQAFDDVYDDWYGSHRTPGAKLDAMVRFVTERCPSGVVVELGVGSGRLAVPLHRAGLLVIGVDASQPMLSRCPPSILRVAADMGGLPFRAFRAQRAPDRGAATVAPTFLCGFNTLFNVGSTDGLDRLLAAVASLRATLIVEMLNIEVLPTEPTRSTDLAPFPVDRGIVVSSTSADVTNRRLAGRHLEITDRGVVSRPWLLHLVGHDELDDRAAGHGLHTVERYRSWEAEPFGVTDHTSISVYAPDLPADRPR
ncbi:MAG: class I SAM-dependent methyltransferase [Acidimicrobiia bacterium]|nr:class I SAM-dependent methyltransferase [Acidimicrobiia bacterium]